MLDSCPLLFCWLRKILWQLVHSKTQIWSSTCSAKPIDYAAHSFSVFSAITHLLQITTIAQFLLKRYLSWCKTVLNLSSFFFSISFLWHFHTSITLLKVIGKKMFQFPYIFHLESNCQHLFNNSQCTDSSGCVSLSSLGIVVANWPVKFFVISGKYVFLVSQDWFPLFLFLGITTPTQMFASERG